MNNATLLMADRTTHLKIVVIALVASIAVVMIAVGVRGEQRISSPSSRPRPASLWLAAEQIASKQAAN